MSFSTATLYLLNTMSCSHVILLIIKNLISAQIDFVLMDFT